MRYNSSAYKNKNCGARKRERRVPPAAEKRNFFSRSFKAARVFSVLRNREDTNAFAWKILLPRRAHKTVFSSAGKAGKSGRF